MRKKRENKGRETDAAISLRSFLTVVALLTAVLIFCGALSYWIPQGSFDRDTEGNILPGTYEAGSVKGIAPWRVITAPVRVFASEDGLTILMISLFLLVMNGVFRLLDSTSGLQGFIQCLIGRLRGSRGPVICVMTLVFMLFGSLFGMFEELAALLPLVIAVFLSMGLDTMSALGACLMAACFGFSTAITNPFSVGTAAQLAGIPVSSGLWLRAVFFVIIYLVVCGFLLGYLKKLRRDPQISPTYSQDQQKRQELLERTGEAPADQQRLFRVYAVFFGIQAVVLLTVACVRAISGLAIPILAASFLISGLIAGQLVCRDLRRVLRSFLAAAAAMLPAVALIALASSVKLVLAESRVMDTVMHWALSLLTGRSKFVTVLLLYGLILFLQLFIGSASAKIFLVMPIVLPVTNALGISPTLVILTYCMADGFTDVILPTNPVLLVGLSMANVSYWKWLKWTWKLQLLLLAVSGAVLLFGVWIGY